MHEQPRPRRGFTVIELIIVIAIIAVLAAITVPTYLSHVADSQVSEAMSLLEDAETAIDAYVMKNGEFPSAALDTRPELDHALDIETSGQYVKGIVIAKANKDGSGVLKARFRDTNVASALESRIIVVARNKDSAWACRTDIAADTAPNDCPHASNPVSAAWKAAQNL